MAVQMKLIDSLFVLWQLFDFMYALSFYLLLVRIEVFHEICLLVKQVSRKFSFSCVSLVHYLGPRSVEYMGKFTERTDCSWFSAVRLLSMILNA